MAGRIFQGLENNLSLSYAFLTMCLNPAFAISFSPGGQTDTDGGCKTIKLRRGLPSGAQIRRTVL